MQTLFLDISNITNIKMTPKSADGGVFLQSKQGDVGRQFKAVIMDGEQEFPIPAGAQFSVWYSGPSGEGNYSSIGDRSAFSVDGNTVTVEMIAQMLRKPGSGTLCLVLNTAQGKQLGLWNVIYAVEHVVGMDSEPAEDYYTALSELARQAINAAATFETDGSLTVAGKAADAAAVGVGLAGKAPAGYGLGGLPKNVSGQDLNSFTYGGFYSWESATNAPFFWGYMIVIPGHVGEGTTQIAYCLDASKVGSAAQRTLHGWSTWSEWEWVNPPMVLGVEYRTTERWNGKAVYTCLVNCGNPVNNGIKTTYHYLNITQCISCEACTTTGDSFPVKYVSGGSDVYANAYANKSSVHVYTSGDFSTTATVCAKLRYTKD